MNISKKAIKKNHITNIILFVLIVIVLLLFVTFHFIQRDYYINHPESYNWLLFTIDSGTLMDAILYLIIGIMILIIILIGWRVLSFKKI